MHGRIPVAFIDIGDLTCVFNGSVAGYFAKHSCVRIPLKESCIKDPYNLLETFVNSRASNVVQEIDEHMKLWTSCIHPHRFIYPRGYRHVNVQYVTLSLYYIYIYMYTGVMHACVCMCVCMCACMQRMDACDVAWCGVT